MAGKSHNFYQFTVETKTYDNLDDLKKHVRHSANPVVDVSYINLNCKKYELISVNFFSIFNE